MSKRFVYMRPMANGQAFPEGIHDTVTGENIFLENDIMKVMAYLESVTDKSKQLRKEITNLINEYKEVHDDNLLLNELIKIFNKDKK